MKGEREASTSQIHLRTIPTCRTGVRESVDEFHFALTQARTCADALEVIRALDAVTGILNQPDVAHRLMAGDDVAFADLDLDSLSTLEMIMQIEDRFGVELDVDMVSQQVSVDGLVGWLERNVAPAAS